MNLRQAQLRRLVENSFPEIQNFHEKVTVRYEKLENAKSFWSEIYLARLKVNDGGEDELQNVLVYYSKFEEALTLENVSPEVFGNQKRIHGIKWAFDYEKKNKATKQAISEIPGIICHADLNVTNMLWKKDSATHEIGAIIDYQMLFIGSIAFDIIRVLTLGLSREDRKEKTNCYLDYYHKTLSELFHGSAPFSLDQLNNQYFFIYPFASNFTLFGIAMYIKMYSDGTLGSPEFKEANCAELVDRANGIVEDIEALEKNFI
ncbi:hypothetical protein CAEBREN_14629 [Caenorhabditis brenneri]|uniref:CHK kinase-like domain-containing protein n=1 Tax=Caenorhabditis brenneri TaxID=135651 RepID=G0P0Q4_CAEBE|nr:hypothetical protein CAEBREN_14629 [Caenorhabditis brenneri]